MIIEDINTKLRFQKEFCKSNDQNSSMCGTATVLIKENCLSNLAALFYLVEELPISLSFFKNCRKGKRRHTFLAIAKNVQIQAASSFHRELILVLL